MTFDPDRLLARLDELQAGRPARRYVVAYSGGLDSSVLLHALAATRQQHGLPILAVHVNHGLSPDADGWEDACRRRAGELAVDFDSVAVTVPEHSGEGLEAAARRARYAALHEKMREGDVVLTAHHEDDQAETLLLNLLRGSGVAGLAGIGAAQPFGEGRLLRPLLDLPRESLRRYALGVGLAWLDDPANEDPRFDRNYLRAEVLPCLQARWPAAAARLRASAALAAEAAQLLEELAARDLALLDDGGRVDIPGLRELSPARQRNVLRLAIRRAGLPPAPATRLEQALRDLLPAREDAQPLVTWPGAELRRYRDRLFLLEEQAGPSRAAAPGLAPGTPAQLGAGLGSLWLEKSAEGGLAPRLLDAPLRLRFRHGGEKLKPHGRRETHRVKKLFQEHGVLPWMRERVPLIYAGDELVAVADLWIADSAWSAPGYAVRWRDRPQVA